jgi:hypothetical protein
LVFAQAELSAPGHFTGCCRQHKLVKAVIVVVIGGRPLARWSTAILLLSFNRGFVAQLLT